MFLLLQETDLFFFSRWQYDAAVKSPTNSYQLWSSPTVKGKETFTRRPYYIKPAGSFTLVNHLAAIPQYEFGTRSL